MQIKPVVSERHWSESVSTLCTNFQILVQRYCKITRSSSCVGSGTGLAGTATIALLPSFWKGLLEANNEENPLQCHTTFERSLWHEWLEKLYPTSLTGLLNNEADVKMPKGAVAVWRAFKSLPLLEHAFMFFRYELTLFPHVFSRSVAGDILQKDM